MLPVAQHWCQPMWKAHLYGMSQLTAASIWAVSCPTFFLPSSQRLQQMVGGEAKGTLANQVFFMCEFFLLSSAPIGSWAKPFLNVIKP